MCITRLDKKTKLYRMKTSILFILKFSLFTYLLIFLSSCGSKNESQNIETAASVSFLPPKISESAAIDSYEVREETSDELVSKDNYKETKKTNQSSSTVKKIIKNGNISIKTKDVNASKKQIDTVAKNLKAYYDKEDLDNNDQFISYSISIRVPAANFEKLVTALENGKDEITYKSIQSSDVTEEYYDVQGRLANKKAYLLTYKKLLSRANTIKDILAIEENIRVIQEEIDSQEGRLKYLNDQVDFSTLYLDIRQEKAFVYKAEEQDSFFERVKKSLSTGWTSLVDFLLVLVSIWPWIISISALLIFLRFKFLTRKKKK